MLVYGWIDVGLNGSWLTSWMLAPLVVVVAASANSVDVFEFGESESAVSASRTRRNGCVGHLQK